MISPSPPSPCPKVNSQNSLVSQQSIPPPPNLSIFSRTLTRRYTTCSGRSGSVVGSSPEVDDEWDEASDREDTESSSSSDSDSSCEDHVKGRIFRNPERASRVVFLDLPIEILELIASSLHDPLPIEAAARFIDERYSDFCVARFWLSGFSKVCSSVRKTVERVLYREVQLDFTGWKGRKHPIWRAGSLRLLLRTFEERPELGRFVHGASLDYQLYNEPGPLDLGLKQFLMLTPNLKTLFMAQCPLVLWDLPPLNISTFATTFAPGILPSILQQFPKLQNIHLRDCHVMPFSLDLPKHNLRTVRFDSSHDHAVVHFARALTLCFDTVHHLDIRFIGGFLQPAPFFAPKSPSIKCSLNTRLRSLRLHNISVFSHVGSAYAQLLQNLPALQELHVSNHMCFDPLAFSVLPSSLRKLTISDYYGYWEMRPEDAGNTFLLALAKSINISPRKIRHIVGANGRNTHDLSPVVAACELEGIKYSDVDDKNGFVQIFFSIQPST